MLGNSTFFPSGQKYLPKNYLSKSSAQLKWSDSESPEK